MRKYILTCSCHNIDKKAAEAFRLIFPNEAMPEIIRGRDRVMKLAVAHNNDHLKALARLSGKYMYYVELDGDEIVQEYDLTKGTKIR